MKIKGPKIDPWGTPNFKYPISEKTLLLITTFCDRSVG